MLGGFAAALIFIMLLIAEILVGLFVVCYAGDCFLIAVQDTAAGNDEVTWPDEPLQDWLARGLHIAGILLVGFVPAGIVRGILISQRIEGDYFMAEIVGAVVLNWLLFPIILLSSLSGSSRLFLVRLEVLRQLIRIPGTVLILYFVTGLLVAGWLALVYFTFARTSWLLLPGAAVAGAAFLLLYARLLGRIAWKLNELKPPKRKAPDKIKPVLGGKTKAHDPWAVPVEQREEKKAAEATPTHSPEEVYGFAEDPVALPPAVAPLDGFPAIEEEAFEIEDVPEPARNERSSAIGRHISRADKQEEALTVSTKPTPAPAWPLLSGVYSFPWYASNWKVLIFLSLGGMLMGALAMLMEVPG